MPIDSILTVCTGNICRSPLAEAMLAAELADRRIASAGVRALVGYPADPNAQAVALEHNLDVSSHVARQIDAQLIHDHELVLAMETPQMEWIVRQFPQARGRVFLLGHWSGNAEVPDPYRHPLDAFRDSYSLIAQYLAQWRSRVA